MNFMKVDRGRKTQENKFVLKSKGMFWMKRGMLDEIYIFKENWVITLKNICFTGWNIGFCIIV